MNHSLNHSVAVAGNTQAEKKEPGRKPLIIGLDFGAAFSKVVIGDKRVKYAVPFTGFAHADNQYLLPSLLNIDDNQQCHLTSADAADSMAENLKFPLLNNTYSEEDLLRLAAYLALVFRASTGWLLQRYKKRYGRSKLAWSVNAGLPLDSASDSKLSGVYKDVLHTAWIISVLPGPITLNRVRQYMEAKESVFDAFPALYRSKIIKKNSINIITGCRAQICGYVHSKNCSDDLHMLIDVGASTVNIATFMVENIRDASRENTCTLYDCAVEPVGVHYLLKRRYENLQLPENEINLFKDIPDNQAFSQARGLTEKDIKFADTLYSGDVARLINKIMDKTKSRYCPDSKSWQSGVQTFVYGGGAHLEILQNVIHRLENKAPPHKIVSIKLDAPDDLMVENLPADSYDRLSMAYGLSFAAEEIAQVSKEALAGENEKTAEV